MKNLENRVVIITGASSGIGRETALAFAEKRCRVALCARRKEKLEEVASLIEKRGGSALSEAVDVAHREQVKPMVEKVMEVWRRIDIVVCNAGYGYLAPVEEIDPAELLRIWEVNFMGSLYLIQASLPYMRKQKEGHVVLVSSVVGRYSLPWNSAYCVTKFAQAALGQSLRPEVKESGIGVTLVYPGYTATEFAEKRVNPQGKQFGLNRRGQPAEEVARKIVRAVLKNKKELYPSLSGRLFAYAGLWFPWLMDELMTRWSRRLFR